MPRGQASSLGTEKVAQNGYTWVKTENGWKSKHVLIAERNLGRPIRPDERVYFADKNRNNFSPSNIIVEVSQQRRNLIFTLQDKVEKMQKELDEIKRKLEKLASESP